MVLEEPMVLHHHQARDQYGRRFPEPEQDPVLVVAGVDASDQGRIQPCERRRAVGRAECPHDTRLDPDLEPPGGLHRVPEPELARLDEEPAATAGVASGSPRAIVEVVSGTPKLVFKHGRFDPGARPELHRPGVDPCGERPPFAFELGPDPNVEPSDVAGEEYEGDEGRPPRERPHDAPDTDPTRPR